MHSPSGDGTWLRCRDNSGNRCLARWTVWIPHPGPRGRGGSSKLEGRPGQGPDPMFLGLEVWGEGHNYVGGPSNPGHVIYRSMLT
jgi:hypothetical protein